MAIAKALILAGDVGGDARGGPVAVTPPQHLFPLANRPILQHHVAGLRAAAVEEAVVLGDVRSIGPLREALGNGRDHGVALTYALWEPAVGLGGALAITQDFVAGDPVLVQHGDALLHDHLEPHLEAFERERLDALALCFSDMSRLAPTATTPSYVLSARAVAILADGRRCAAPIADVRAAGGRVREEPVAGVLPCVAEPASLLEGNRVMLQRLTGTWHPDSLEASDVQGPVEIHPTARVRRSTVRGPVIIGPNATIDGSYVGPYTSVGAGVAIEGSEVEHSIVLADAELRFVGTRVESSVIGRGARVVRDFQPPGGLHLVVGDGAEVRLC